MPLYPEIIARCQHIKINGTQCASPALRRRKFCYFHKQFRQKQLEINSSVQQQRWKVTLPVLEDANSIQMGLAQIMRLLITRQVDHRTAGLLLYALQTAASNLKRTSFEPPTPTHVVIDCKSVERRPIGATAWSSIKGREYDEVEDNDAEEDGQKDGPCGEELMRLLDLVILDPELRAKRASERLAKQEKSIER